MNECKKFWIVWGVSKGVPVAMHHAHLHACEEAKRLSVKDPGYTFVVMCAEKSFSIAQVPAFTETIYK